MTDEMEINLPVAEAIIDNVVAEKVAEERSEEREDAHVQLERDRIEAEVAKVAISADAQVEIERLRAEGDNGDDDRWTTLETFCLTTLDTLETLQASNLQLHREIAELKSAAAGRKEKSVEAPEAEAIIEPDAPASEKPASEDSPPPPSEARTRRRLIV